MDLNNYLNKVILLLCLIFSISVQSQTCSEYYLIRHAEKLRVDKNDNNPKLNDAGILRSEKWKEVFKNISFDEIFSTNYNRTLETVLPISKQRDIEIKIYNPRNVNYSEFKSKTIGKNILVVGHSNTIPGFANSLIGEDIYAQIDDRNNSNLYIITICNEKIHHKVLYIK